MAANRPSITAAFLALFGIGAMAFAIVVIALGFNASSTQRIEDTERDSAAIELLEQRHTVAALLAAEQAAAVLDLIAAGDAMVSPPFTAQRGTVLESATDVVRVIADRTDSVGAEANRWLAAIDAAIEPTTIGDTFLRLVAYDDIAQAACCAGIVSSDQHHTDTLRGLESAAATPASMWDYFYIAAEVASRTPPALPIEVNRFLEHMGTPSRLPRDARSPSDVLEGSAMPNLTTLGVSQETINTVLAGDAIATIDQVALDAGSDSAATVTIDEVFVAADAASRSLDELFASAIENTRTRLTDEVNAAEQIRLITIVVTPLLLLVLVGIGIAVNRTGRKREKAMQREQQLLNSRNRFIRMVSHELRTPATAISGFAQMLSSQWTSLTEPEISEFLRIVDRQSTHLTLIVDDLLTLSHLETGRLRLHLSTAKLAEAASDAIAMVDARYGIEVAMSIDPDLIVIADPDRLVQILRNLVENAAKYGGAGVAVTAVAVGKGCEIIVSDTGPGVSPEAAERIFRFWDRGDQDSDNTRGHGMGLAIARHLARAMVGDLKYRPHEPIGSEFILTLPLGSTTRIDTAGSDTAEKNGLDQLTT